MKYRTKRPVFETRALTAKILLGGDESTIYAIDLRNGPHALLPAPVFHALFEYLPNSSPYSPYYEGDFQKLAEAAWQWYPGCDLEVTKRPPKRIRQKGTRKK